MIPVHFLGKNIFQNQYQEDIRTLHISLNPDLVLYVYIRTRAEQWWNLAAVSRRDLSYETDSGPKAKTAETVIWDLAYDFSIVIFYSSSASAIFLTPQFFNLVRPVRLLAILHMRSERLLISGSFPYDFRNQHLAWPSHCVALELPRTS